MRCKVRQFDLSSDFPGQAGLRACSSMSLKTLTNLIDASTKLTELENRQLYGGFTAQDNYGVSPRISSCREVAVKACRLDRAVTG